MPKHGKQKAKEIQKELWEKSKKEGVEGVVKWETVKETIRDKAGWSKQTIEKYRDGMVESGMMEQLPNTDKYEIEEPETKDKLDLAGTKARVTLEVDRELKEQGENLDVNFTNVFVTALVEEITDRKEYLRSLLEEEMTDSEIEIVMKFLLKDLYDKRGEPKKEAKRDRRRRKVYREVMDLDKVDDHKKVEDLRKKAFSLAEEIGVKDMK